MENENRTENRLQMNLQRDIREITKLVEGYVKTTYVKEIENELFRCRQKCEGNPSKEIDLFHALMPYIPAEKKNMCEDIVRLLQYEQIIAEMIPNFSKNYARTTMRTEQDNVKLILMKVLLYNMMSGKEKRKNNEKGI